MQCFGLLSPEFQTPGLTAHQWSLCKGSTGISFLQWSYLRTIIPGSKNSQNQPWKCVLKADTHLIDLPLQCSKSSTQTCLVLRSVSRPSPAQPNPAGHPTGTWPMEQMPGKSARGCSMNKKIRVLLGWGQNAKETKPTGQRGKKSHFWVGTGSGRRINISSVVELCAFDWRIFCGIFLRDFFKNK